MMDKPFSPSEYAESISSLPTDLLESELARLEKVPVLQRFVTLQKISLLKSELNYRKKQKANES